jgi:hypothetical protein
LKLAMENVRNRNEEQKFYKLELRARRKRRDKEVPWWKRAASVLYAGVSDNGNSITRPLGVIFLGLIPLFTLIFFVLAEVLQQRYESCGPRSCDVGADLDRDLAGAFSLAWANVFRPLSALSSDAAKPDDRTLASALLFHYGEGWAILVQVLATTESLFAILLAFLSALAVRRRFQIS